MDAGPEWEHDMDDLDLDDAVWTVETNADGESFARFLDGSRGPAGWFPGV